MQVPTLKITHIPTGISVKTDYFRDVEMARRVCLKVIAAKIAALNQEPIHHLIIEHGNGEDMQLAINEWQNSF